ncbi:MAG: TRAP transporter small permease [Gracilibacteraceae bacterium]|nr:TRAP transporter small permease [Gracilibacteraceae bacterium]
MLRILNKGSEGLNRLCQILLVLSITILVAAMFIQILRRVFIGSTFTWVDGVARYMLIWGTFLGAAIAAKESEHISLTFIADKLTGKANQIFECLLYLCFAFLACYAVFAGIQAVQLVLPQKSDSLPISVAWIYGAIPFCEAIIVFHLGVNFINKVAALAGFSAPNGG